MTAPVLTSACLPVRTEAREIMELVQPYYDAVPSSWQRFADQADAKLRDFTMHEIQINFGRGGVDFGLLFVPWLGYGCFCLTGFFFLAWRGLKRTYAEGRAEIERRRWTPPSLGVSNARVRQRWVLK